MSITSNLTNKDKDRLERIWNLLQDAENLQQERINSGCDYVHLYVEDVESDWLENWGSDVTELPVRLRQWFHHVFDADWYSIEEMFGSPETNVALQTAGIKRAKWIDLGDRVALIVTIKQESSERISILLQIHSPEQSMYLPENMQLSAISNVGEVLGGAIAHSTSHTIQIEFTVAFGAEFTVEITADNRQEIQEFLI
jgi:hypothetical protein